MGWPLDLTEAVYNNNFDLVKRLLQRDEVRMGLGRQEWVWGEAPLHRAAAIGRNDVLRMLVEAGGDVGSYSKHDNGDRMTCLHWAVWCNQTDTVRLLLDWGADTSLQGTWLEFQGTPLDFARQYRHHEILELFRQAAAGMPLMSAGANMHNNSFEVEDGRMSQLSLARSRKASSMPFVVNKVQTSAILSGLENLPAKEKALQKATELQRKHTRVTKNVEELRKKLAQTEKELFEINSDPNYLNQDAIEELSGEIAELIGFASEVKKLLIKPSVSTYSTAITPETPNSIVSAATAAAGTSVSAQRRRERDDQRERSGSSRRRNPEAEFSRTSRRT